MNYGSSWKNINWRISMMPFAKKALPPTYCGTLRKTKFDKSDWMWDRGIDISEQKSFTRIVYQQQPCQQVWYHFNVHDIESKSNGLYAVTNILVNEAVIHYYILGLATKNTTTTPGNICLSYSELLLGFDVIWWIKNFCIMQLKYLFWHNTRPLSGCQV